MKKLIALLVVVAVLGVAAQQGYAWYDRNTNTAAGSGTAPVAFRITTGEGADAIGEDLLSKGLIRSLSAWTLYTRITGARSKFQAGEYSLRPNMSMVEIVQKLEHAVAAQLEIRIVEGLTIKQMGRLAQRKGLGSAQDYVNAARGAWPFDFLASRPPGADLQGYLFPDTYNLDRTATVRDLITRQLTEFGQKFTPEWRSAIQHPTAERPAESINNVVIMASIVQLEADTDLPKVCSVYYNRLANNMPLQVDATILFAEGRAGIITDADRKFDSPYNTYLHAGLPPGPIGSPGAAALSACVNPPRTDFLFYFTDRQGATHFEETEDSFNADIARYGVKGT